MGLSYRTWSETEQLWQIFEQACENLRTSKKRANRAGTGHTATGAGAVGMSGKAFENEFEKFSMGKMSGRTFGVQSLR
jgi:hypothetical protein